MEGTNSISWTPSVVSGQFLFLPWCMWCQLLLTLHIDESGVEIYCHAVAIVSLF